MNGMAEIAKRTRFCVLSIIQDTAAVISLIMQVLSSLLCRTMSILTEMMRQDQSAKSFRERQASLGHTLPLGSYLLKPVQRILKYHLLLQVV